MSNKPIKFQSYELSVGMEFLKKDDAKKLECKNKIYIYREATYIVNIIMVKDKYLFFDFTYGAPLPYSNVTLETKEEKVVETKRSLTDAELNKQFFGLYNFTTQKIFLSNKKKKQDISNYLQECLSKEIIIKNIYKSPEEFYNAVKTISKIRLVTSRDLITSNDSVFSEKVNVFGLGNPNQYEIECNFHKIKKTSEFKDYINKAFNRKKTGEIDKLICVGYDDFDMEKVFNIDSFTDKIEINVENKNGMVDTMEVQKELIQKLGE